MNMTIERGKIAARIRQSARGLRLGLVGLACLAAVSVSAPAQTFIEFNAPGALTRVPTAGTFPLSNNIAGQIVGYVNNNGFVGIAGGTITTFAVSGAACCTVPESINSAGVIAGNWEDANGAHHGFVRAADGTITSFDGPNASTIAGKGTFPQSINTAGVIVGHCNCKGYDGFVRAADGTITTFEAPDASETLAFSINTGGAIAGYYFDASDVVHGFVRAADGTITSFDAPGAGTTDEVSVVLAQGTFALSINDDGVIVGYYVDASEGYHGFVRAADGTITTLNAPGAGTGTSSLTGDSLGTKALSINDDGVITGYYIDPNEVYHGFMVSASGAITTFNAPGAGTTEATGTYARSINDNGLIVGYYSDSGDVYHGFQLTP
jgi:hypothetical protein